MTPTAGGSGWKVIALNGFYLASYFNPSLTIEAWGFIGQFSGTNKLAYSYCNNSVVQFQAYPSKNDIQIKPSSKLTNADIRIFIVFQA